MTLNVDYNSIPQKLDFNERWNSFPPWAIRALEAMPKEKLWSYPDRQQLEARLADKFGLKNDQVLVTNGVDEAIQILLGLVNKEENIILPLPTFSMYEIGIKEWALNCTTIPALPDLSLNIEATIDKVGQQRGGFVVMVRPNNPSGEHIPIHQVKQLARICEAQNTTLVLDEAYVEFASDSAASLLSEFKCLLVFRTFSKAYGLAGLRVGYALGNVGTVSRLRKRCLPFNVNSISLYVAEQALTTEAENEVLSYCQTVQKNRATISQQLSSYGRPVLQSEGNFICLALNTMQSRLGGALCRKLNISVRDFTQDYLSSYIRVTIPADISRLRLLFKSLLSPDLVCLDMDGVLIDTSDSYDTAIQKTYTHFTQSTIDLDAIQSKRMAGGYNNDWVLTQALLHDNGLDADLKAVTQCFQRYYLGDATTPGLIANEKVLVEKSLIKHLESSYRLSIVTGRPREEALMGKKLCGFNDIDVISLDDVKEGKPSPEGILKQKKKYAAEVVWMCGDNVDDMIAAKKAGAIAIGIGANTGALMAAGADIVLTNINMLEELLCQS